MLSQFLLLPTPSYHLVCQIVQDTLSNAFALRAPKAINDLMIKRAKYNNWDNKISNIKI